MPFVRGTTSRNNSSQALCIYLHLQTIIHCICYLWYILGEHVLIDRTSFRQVRLFDHIIVSLPTPAAAALVEGRDDAPSSLDYLLDFKDVNTYMSCFTHTINDCYPRKCYYGFSPSKYSIDFAVYPSRKRGKENVNIYMPLNHFSSIHKRYENGLAIKLRTTADIEERTRGIQHDARVLNCFSCKENAWETCTCASLFEQWQGRYPESLYSRPDILVFLETWPSIECKNIGRRIGEGCLLGWERSWASLLSCSIFTSYRGATLCREFFPPSNHEAVVKLENGSLKNIGKNNVSYIFTNEVLLGQNKQNYQAKTNCSSIKTAGTSHSRAIMDFRSTPTANFSCRTPCCYHRHHYRKLYTPPKELEYVSYQKEGIYIRGSNSEKWKFGLFPVKMSSITSTLRKNIFWSRIAAALLWAAAVTFWIQKVAIVVNTRGGRIASYTMLLSATFVGSSEIFELILWSAQTQIQQWFSLVLFVATILCKALYYNLLFCCLLATSFGWQFSRSNMPKKERWFIFGVLSIPQILLPLTFILRDSIGLIYTAMYFFLGTLTAVICLKTHNILKARIFIAKSLALPQMFESTISVMRMFRIYQVAVLCYFTAEVIIYGLSHLFKDSFMYFTLGDGAASLIFINYALKIFRDMSLLSRLASDVFMVAFTGQVAVYIWVQTKKLCKLLAGHTQYTEDTSLIRSYTCLSQRIRKSIRGPAEVSCVPSNCRNKP